MRPVRLTSGGGVEYRDLNGNGRMDPFEDPRLPLDERVEDLLGRLSPGGEGRPAVPHGHRGGRGRDRLERPGAISKSPTPRGGAGQAPEPLQRARASRRPEAARWHNALQELAEQTPHGIPVTFSTDPRHAFIENAGPPSPRTSFSQWPEPLGLAAIGDAALVGEFADIARQEYVRRGHPRRPAPDARPRHRAAMGAPVADLRAGPRPRRRARRRLPARASSRTRSGRTASRAPRKHFPGGGPQKDGEDPHFPYGREQVYPGGRFDDHLRPVPRRDRGRNRGDHAVLRHARRPRARRRADRGGRLRLQPPDRHRPAARAARLRRRRPHRLGAGQRQPCRRPGAARPGPGVSSTSTRTSGWSCILDAGADQFGGEECVEVLLDLVAQGRVTEARIDESARRLLRGEVPARPLRRPVRRRGRRGADRSGREDFRAAGLPRPGRVGHGAPERQDDGPVLPLAAGLRIYAEGVDARGGRRLGTPVDRPEDADVAVVRLMAPFEPALGPVPRVVVPPGLARLPARAGRAHAAIAAHCPSSSTSCLDRPAVLTPLLPAGRRAWWPATAPATTRCSTH